MLPFALPGDAEAGKALSEDKVTFREEKGSGLCPALAAEPSGIIQGGDLDAFWLHGPWFRGISLTEQKLNQAGSEHKGSCPFHVGGSGSVLVSLVSLPSLGALQCCHGFE